MKTFEHYYSFDGLTAAVVAGHDEDLCFVANPKMFEVLDSITRKMEQVGSPGLKRRLKQAIKKTKTAP